MYTEYTFEYESLKFASEEYYGLLQVTVELDITYDRFEQSFTTDIIKFHVINVDTNQEVSFKSLPHNEQDEIESKAERLAENAARLAIGRYENSL